MLIGEAQGRGKKLYQHHGKCPAWIPSTGDTGRDSDFTVFRITQSTHLFFVSLPQ